MEGNQSRRIDFVDLTKGVCIILVVMAHVGGAFEQLDTNSMLSCFRMPLYFFISGVFFKSYEGLLGFILRKINKLIIPFLFFYLSAFLMKYIVWKIAPGVFQLPVSWNELLVVFHGHDLIKFNPPIWFLLALFNCNILFYLIHFLREKHLPVMFAVTILIGCAGFYLGKLQIELPLYIDVSMTALPFYVAGFCCIGTGGNVLYRYHIGYAYQQLCGKYFSSIYRCVCRNIYDYVTLQKSEKDKGCFLLGTIFNHHLEYSWTDTSFFRSISQPLYSQ